MPRQTARRHCHPPRREATLVEVGGATFVGRRPSHTSAQHLPFRLAYITDTLGRPDAVAVAVTEHVATLDAPPPATTLLGMTRSTS